MCLSPVPLPSALPCAPLTCSFHMLLATAPFVCPHPISLPWASPHALLLSAPLMYSSPCPALRWVRSVAVDPGNEWFATGSADRTIKIWDLASGQLKLTLTGHIEQVRTALESPGYSGVGNGEGGPGGLDWHACYCIFSKKKIRWAVVQHAGCRV